MIFAYLLPDNPLKQQYNLKQNPYIHPYFEQSWSMFAPRPAHLNLYVSYKFKLVSDSDTIELPIFNATEPLTIDKKNNFWSPSQRLSKWLQSSAQNIFETFRENTLESEKEKLKQSEEFNKVLHQSLGHKLLVNYSRFVLKKYIQTNNIKVQKYKIYCSYIITSEQFPMFSKRNENFYDKSKYTYSNIKSGYYLISL
jgi:hypothetical protein